MNTLKNKICIKCQNKYKTNQCSYCKTLQIMALPPGAKVYDSSGKEYIRMLDNIDCHIEGGLFDPETGSWIHASRICYP